MLSRIADSLYWMSRFLERADNTARLIDINVVYMLEASEDTTKEVLWEPLLEIVDCQKGFNEAYDDGRVTGERVVRYLTQERSNAGSLYNSLRLARENARVARDRISQQMWEAINEFWLHIDQSLKTPLSVSRAAGLYQYVRNEVARYHGLTTNTMMRGEAFGFTLLGTLLERADMSARILDVKYHLLLPDVSLVGSPLDYYQWGALLKSLSGFEAYRRQYHTGIRPIDVAEFVILEPNFPRSLRFCLNRMTEALEQIGVDLPDCQVCHNMVALQQQLDAVSAESILQQGLHEFLEEFLMRLAKLHDALHSEFFEAHLSKPEEDTENAISA